MGRERSALKIYGHFLIGLFLIRLVRVSLGVTNPNDVAAINNLYVALGSPVLPGWLAAGGDPCGEAWQGVQCNDTNILRIVINAANLGGELGDDLNMFTSIRGLDLSNNHIGGSIPTNLPVTLQTIFLSANQFTGSIPESLSSLNLLTAMSLNSNLLSGELPDAFESLTGLINLDLSGNNFSGKLPPSFGSLSSLTTFRLQNNKFSGTLDVLQDLPLRDLNVENNLFSGPIPEKLLSIPNFKKDGNPFDTTIAPLPAPISPPILPSAPTLSPPSPGTPSRTPSGKTPAKQADGPSSSETSSSGGSKKTVKKVVWISIAGVISFIILVLALLLLIPMCARRRRAEERISKRHRIGAYQGDRENPPTDNANFVQPSPQKAPKEVVVRPKENPQTEPRRMGATPRKQNEQVTNVQTLATIPKREDRKIDFGVLDECLMPPPPPPPPATPPPPPPPPPPAPSPPPPPPPPPPQPLAEKVIVKPIVPFEMSAPKPSPKVRKTTTAAKFFSIASLQQYTDSFSQDNLIGGGTVGSVYRAQLPDGKFLAVKKFDKRAISQQKEEEFVDLVNNIDKIRHANVVELMGYCAEHGQRLLIYEYCSNGSLQDALHSDDEFKRKLSWNSRIRMALGAARALEYLHEVCDPPVVHRNFKSGNVLLDDDLSVRVSDCGLSPLISSGSVSQLSGHLLSSYGYGAPEFESGIYTYQSDIYSFGVVMLEILTGRKSYDRNRTRGEQFLVRWAIPQLHDIDALSRMVDPSLIGQYPAKSLSHFADIISRCVQSEPEFRPLMSEVVQDLLDMIRREGQGSGSNEDW